MTFQRITDHKTPEGTKQSICLAKEGVQKPIITDQLDLEIPDKYNLQGAKLSVLTQATVYMLLPCSGSNQDYNICIDGTACLIGLRKTDQTEEKAWLT